MCRLLFSRPALPASHRRAWDTGCKTSRAGRLAGRVEEEFPALTNCVAASWRAGSARQTGAQSATNLWPRLGLLQVTVLSFGRAAGGWTCGGCRHASSKPGRCGGSSAGSAVRDEGRHCTVRPPGCFSAAVAIMRHGYRAGETGQNRRTRVAVGGEGCQRGRCQRRRSQPQCSSHINQTWRKGMFIDGMWEVQFIQLSSSRVQGRG